MSTATIQRNQITAYQQPIDEVLAALGTDARRGLSEGEAQARLKRYGKNELTAEKPIPRWRKFLAQFQDVLVILLLIATLISAGLWLYERESALPYEAIAIFAVVLLNAVMGYIQESRAEQAVAALRQMSAAHANVIRDGARQSITATEVAPGDIILIEEGDTVPADARLIQSTALQTAEAALTGESLPVSKDTLPITEEVGLGDRHNMLFSGTAATYGRGKAVVIATGMQTQMGLIAGMLKETPTETTPLQKQLARVGKLLGPHLRCAERLTAESSEARERAASGESVGVYEPGWRSTSSRRSGAPAILVSLGRRWRGVIRPSREVVGVASPLSPWAFGWSPSRPRLLPRVSRAAAPGPGSLAPTAAPRSLPCASPRVLRPSACSQHSSVLALSSSVRAPARSPASFALLCSPAPRLRPSSARPVILALARTLQKRSQ